MALLGGNKKTDSVELVDPTTLNIHPNNPRLGDVGAIATSIEQNGWYGTIVAQKSSKNVLAGNHRLQAAIHLNMNEVPVYWVDVNDEEAQKIVLADNRTSDLASYDEHILSTLLSEIAANEDLLGTGYDGDDVDALIADLVDPTSFNPTDFDTEPRLDEYTNIKCPECGHEFQKKK